MLEFLARPPRIELGTSVLETDVLPLNYRRILERSKGFEPLRSFYLLLVWKTSAIDRSANSANMSSIALPTLVVKLAKDRIHTYPPVNSTFVITYLVPASVYSADFM